MTKLTVFQRLVAATPALEKGIQITMIIICAIAGFLVFKKVLPADDYPTILAFCSGVAVVCQLAVKAENIIAAAPDFATGLKDALPDLASSLLSVLSPQIGAQVTDLITQIQTVVSAPVPVVSAPLPMASLTAPAQAVQTPAPVVTQATAPDNVVPMNFVPPATQL